MSRWLISTLTKKHLVVQCHSINKRKLLLKLKIERLQHHMNNSKQYNWTRWCPPTCNNRCIYWVTTQPRARLPQLNDSPMSGDNWGSNVVLFTNLTTSITENNELMHVTATEILKHKIKMHDAFALSYVHGVHSPIITWSWTHNVIADSLFCPSL